VYFAICCLIASIAALASPGLSLGAAHDSVKANAKHEPNARAPAAVLLFGFLTVDHPRDAEAIRDDAKAG